MAKEKDCFQESLLEGDLDALRERRIVDGLARRVSTAQPVGSREVGLMVGTCTGENSERGISMNPHFSRNRGAQGLCDMHTLSVTIVGVFHIQAVLYNGIAKITIN